jgi:recombination protein RecA
MSAKEKTTTAPETDGKAKAIEIAMQQITKQFGEGSIMKMDTDKVRKMDVIPTGAISLDML